MNNNTTLVWQLKRGLLNFVEKLSDGLTRPKVKFLAQMLYGILTSQSVMLTQIGRALQEVISLKKTEDRLSRNLGAFINETSCVYQNYLKIVRPKIDADTIFCIDPGDITKKYSRYQEGMDWIQDGSDHKPALGWYIYGVTALTHGTKLPIPVYMRLVSPDDPMSDGQTEEILCAIKATQEAFGACGIHTMDRGMDVDAIYNHYFETGQRFVIRSKVNRRLISGEETLCTQEIAAAMKGKYRMDFADKHGRRLRLKVSFKSVCLPSHPDKPLTLVMVFGFGKEPMLLATNLPVVGKLSCLRAAKTYLCRWRIEEFYRFLKNQFDLEDVRVLSFDSLYSIVFLLSILSGWIAMFADKEEGHVLLRAVLERAKRVYDIPKFTLYAVGDGIYDILKFATRGIRFALLRPPRSQQLSLFEPSAFNYSVA